MRRSLSMIERIARPAAAILVSLLLPLYAAAETPAPPVHDNAVDYLSMRTGGDREQFAKAYPALAEKAAGNFLDLENKAKLDFTLAVKRPRGFDGFDRFIRRIPAMVATAPEEDRCGKPVEAVFLGVPRGNGERQVLYSYRFLTCAGDPLVSPRRFLDKYIEKYGLYDEKDFDRGQHIYDNVKGRYRVAVRPLQEGKLAALEIQVVDNAVFAEAYKAWRARLRQAEESSKDDF